MLSGVGAPQLLLTVAVTSGRSVLSTHQRRSHTVSLSPSIFNKAIHLGSEVTLYVCHLQFSTKPYIWAQCQKNWTPSISEKYKLRFNPIHNTDMMNVKHNVYFNFASVAFSFSTSGHFMHCIYLSFCVQLQNHNAD